MKKQLTSLFILFSICAFAQVGIGTEHPNSTLDVVGSPSETTVMDGIMAPRLTGDQLEAKTYASPQESSLVYVTSAVTANPSTNPQTLDVNSSGYYYFDGSKWIKFGASENSNSSSIYSADRKGGWSLIDLGVSTTWAKVNLAQLNTHFGAGNIVNGEYVAPSSGYYQVMYEWQLETGVNIEVIGGKGLGLMKNPGLPSEELIDEKFFDAVRINIVGLNLAALPVSSTNLTSIVRLNEGDSLAFVSSKSLVGIGLLNTARVKVSVHKIAN